MLSLFRNKKVGFGCTSAPACVGETANHATRKRNTCFISSEMKNMLIFVMYENFGQCTLVSENMPSSRQSVDKKSHAVETVKCAALSQNRLICPMSSFAENMLFFFDSVIFSRGPSKRERRTRILWGCKKECSAWHFLGRINRQC